MYQILILIALPVYLLGTMAPLTSLPEMGASLLEGGNPRSVRAAKVDARESLPLGLPLGKWLALMMGLGRVTMHTHTSPM